MTDHTHNNRPLTLKDAMSAAYRLGFSLRKTAWADYRLADKSITDDVARENAAYYTNDLVDALDTATSIRSSERRQVAIANS